MNKTLKTEPNFDKVELFNPKGDDSLEKRRVFGGPTSNLLDLSLVKYTWAKQMYHKLIENHWIPQNVSIANDVQEYKALSQEDQTIFDLVLSSLVFLDSIQTTNLPSINDRVTAPEVKLCLTIQTFQEAIHSQSYGYVLGTIISTQRRKGDFFKLWKDIPALYNRNKFLIENISILNKPTVNSDDILRVLLTNYILESMSFYMGFNLIYEIAQKNNCFTGVIAEIRYIQRDELSHVKLFRHILLEFLKENKESLTIDPTQLAQDLFRKAVVLEKEWVSVILSGKKLSGINPSIAYQYIDYLANLRLEDINMPPITSRVENPLVYLDRISGLDMVLVKPNFFEETPTNYNMPSAISGWDEF